MIITTANCPSCGGPITFKVGSSIAVICEFCGSAIARTDRDLRNLGKVADLIDTQSPLRVGLEGRFDGKPFVLTGRVQIGHSAGGVWDEWYATFGDGRTGWLAEAQGRFSMTFLHQVPNAAALPPANYLRPGQPVAIPDAPPGFVVAETGMGRIMGAKGEIPYAVQPGLTYAYADLSGQGGAFATVDYRTTPPVVFTGREVTLKEMGISAVVDEFDAEKRQVKVARMTCPRCNGPVDLRAPNASLRVTCPNCNSLLDVTQGNLVYLRALEQAKPQKFPIGAEAIFDGVTLTLVGYMLRGCQVEGSWYYWEEYLLYEPSVGFRWLVNGESGWYFVESVPPGDVQPFSNRVRFRGKSFALKESVTAVVTYVRGEFYWRVEVGEQAGATDFISRGETLSMEVSGTEVNWSFGRRVDPAALERGFDPRAGRSNPIALPPPRVVTPPKPLPPMWTALATWALLTLLACAVWGAFAATAERRLLLTQGATFVAGVPQTRPDPPTAPDSDTDVGWSTGQVEQTAVLGSFEVTGRKDMVVTIASNASTYGKLWLKLVNDGTGQVRKEQIDTINGEITHHFKSPGPGSYTLYAIRTWYEADSDLRIDVTVRQDVPDIADPILFAVLLLAGPGLLLLMKVLRGVLSE